MNVGIAVKYIQVHDAQVVKHLNLNKLTSLNCRIERRNTYMGKIKRNIEVKLDYEIVAKLDAMIKENKKLHYRGEIINNILNEYFNTRMK